MASMSRTIRVAEPADTKAIIRMIEGLAEYEKLTDQLQTSEESLHEHLFGADPRCEAILAEVAVDGEATSVGFALFFAAYSTFETSPFLFLEDLFVEPSARGAGHGLALLNRLVEIARERKWPRVQWNVLDWNTPAIEFYERFGATLLPDWRTCRVDV